MPLLDIAIPQSFRSNLYSIRFQQRIHHVSFPSSNPKTTRWMRYIHNPVQMTRGRFIVRAVATLEPVNAVEKVKDDASQPENILVAGDNGKEVQVQDEKELLRRKRISKANKGKEAWNKGVKHSPETLAKIRERTRLAMQSPEVKMKLLKGIHNQTPETRLKIAAAVKLTWDRKRFNRRMIARCHREWLDLIAEASRKGLGGEEELQWDSYEIINEQLGKEFREGIESRKKKRGPGPGVRAPKTLEQRKKISEAIAAKWADPAYRDRVYSGIAKQRGKNLSKPRDPDWGTKKKEPKRDRPVKKREGLYNVKTRSQSQPIKAKTSGGPLKAPQPKFKDPQARYKLEMIKSIRARRAASDPKISEAILRANILIGEAQRAADALEAAAAKSPMAEASLIETRKLIAEAMSYIKSIETGNSESLEAGSDKEEIVEGVKEIEQGERVNGTRSVEISKLEEVGLQANVNGTGRADLSSSKASLASSSSLSSSSLSISSDLSLKRNEVEENGKKQEKRGKGRRWVCGRLVEDEDEDEDQ